MTNAGTDIEATGEAPESRLEVRLPWQSSQWQHLEALSQSGRLPHAVVLTGARGIGKLRFGLALAQKLLCAQPVSGTACGECRQCGFLRAGTHPDFKLVTPEEAGKQIKVAQVRELVDFLIHTPQQGGYKVTVIQPAEAMNISAANALLKSLEEPADNTLLILITDAPSRLLATIRSRCQAIPFPVPPWQQALDWLTAVSGTPGQAQELLAEAKGRPLAALDMLASDGLGRRRAMDSDFLAMISGRVGVLTVAEKWLEFELEETLAWLGERISALIAAHTAQQSAPRLWGDMVARADSRELYALLDKVNQLNQQLRSGANPNRQLALEELLLVSCDKFHN